MPFYDYRCTKCEHEELDVKRSITENVATYVCPECESEMQQIYSLFGFDLKGEGWAKDGYGNKIPKVKKTKEDAKKKES